MTLITRYFMTGLKHDRGRWHLGLFLLAFGGLLTWLYIQANAVSAQRHFDYSRTLRELRQSDAEINMEVFANRLEVVRNYDHLAHAVQHAEQVAQALEQFPDFLSEDDRRDLRQRIRDLQQTLREKAAKVDVFKRENATLRNSLAYFPLAADRLVAEDHLSAELKSDIEHYARHLLSLARDPSQERQQQVAQAKRRLQQNRFTTPQSQAAIHNLLLHGDLIVRQLPLMNQDMQAIKQALPFAQLDEIHTAYVRAYQHAENHASYYRRVLYLLALFLSVYLAITLLRLAHGRQSLLRAHHEISQRYVAQLRAEAKLRLHATAFRNSHDGIVLADAQGNILDVNPAFSRITGYSRDEVVGHNPRILKSDRHDAAFYQQMWQDLLQQGAWQGEIWNRNKQGEVYPELLSIAAVYDAEQRIENFVAVFTDIRRLKDQEAQLKQIAYHDALTGLPNRLLLTDHLALAVAQTLRQGNRLAVCYLDLDGFKPVNDQHGHQVGDLLLIEIAQRLLHCVRAVDTVARLGGDEFVVLLQGLHSHEECEQAVQRILEAIIAPIHIHELNLSVSASIGVAWFPQDNVDADLLIRHADQAMYRAKQAGKNRYHLFQPEPEKSA